MSESLFSYISYLCQIRDKHFNTCNFCSIVSHAITVNFKICFRFLIYFIYHIFLKNQAYENIFRKIIS